MELLYGPDLGRLRFPVLIALAPYYHIMPPNQPSCNTPAAYGVIDSFIAASSFHPGGVNVLLMDGSVRFIKSSINLSVWNALGTRAGGEVLSADAF
ncbi:MAG TPA: H-X9-DG-CTERM domain-containing protein [Isosphaeraceae bacterium]|nr:H-X9-DG-CTERM domain-containing protein [Isosphaeraceae bacterium]